ncbi:MAG: HmuY family protein [Bacteroidota bacterium]
MKVLCNISYILCLTLLLHSCEKEETPIVLPSKPADVKLMGVEMGKDYRNQIFVNLQTGATTTIDNLSWDLAFDASENGTLIYQNSGKNILIANTGYTSYQQNQPASQLKFKWDEANGKPDSLVLKNCLKNSKPTDSVYIINRGPSKELFQFKIISVTKYEYMLEFSDMNKTYSKRITISKDPNKSQVYFSFDDGGKYMNMEPARNDWHICFLRYRWIYYEFNPPLLYLVNGTFLNTQFVSAAVDSSMSFYDITKANTASLLFGDQRDVIGFDWKSPDLGNLSNVKYTIRKNVTYFIKEKSGSNQLFKMRFLDYYNSQGVKGSPQFEVQELN